jgi:chromosome segregation ATPase
MSESNWLTYAEAAARLGVTSDALRRRAFRRNWARRQGNDGRTRVLLPDDLLSASPTCAGDDRPNTSGLMSALVDTLTTENTRLVAQLATAESRTTAAEARAAAAEAGRDKADARADKLAADLADMAARMAESEILKVQLTADLAGANERTAAAEARAAVAEARAEAELTAERERSAGHRVDYERERDRADALTSRIAEAENLRGELAVANERATAAEARVEAELAAERERSAAAGVRAVSAEARAVAADARADQQVIELNNLAARMAEILAEQMAPPPEAELEPVRPWWQRWRRRA